MAATGRPTAAPAALTRIADTVTNSDTVIRAGAVPGSGSGRLAPFRYPTFRRLVAAKTATTVGDWMQLVAAGWLTLRLTGSAASVGAITIASRGPGVAMAVYGGCSQTAVASGASALPWPCCRPSLQPGWL